MHHFDETTERILQRATAYVRERLSFEPVPLDHRGDAATLDREAPSLIGESGNDPDLVFDQYEHILSPAVISVDSPRFLSFIPAAPTKASMLFDMVVSASSLNGTSWLESAGAIHAENQVLRAVADLAGLPAGAGGCFLSGGSAGNLSALTVARDVARHRRGDRARMRILASEQTHSSVTNTARILDCDVVTVPAVDGRMIGEQVAAVVAADPDPSTFCAVVATAGTTNAGIIDDLAGIAAVAGDHHIWFHVDAAYGGAGLLSSTIRHRYDGIERADSMIVDPHKWLFAPLDCAILLYRRPALAKGVHTQNASYLDSIHADEGEWNPTDYAYHLTRRARGLAMWFSLATHGLGAYRRAVDRALEVTDYAARRIEAIDELELVRPPDLSIVMFRRRGWTDEQYDAWSEQLLADGVGFVLPSRWEGETILRFAILHPDTTEAIIDEILVTLA